MSADAPPSVQLVEPATEIDRGRGEQAVGRGPGQRRLRAGPGAHRASTGSPGCRRSRPEAVQTVATWSKFASSGAVLNHALELDPAHFKAGQTVWVRALARDRRQLDLPELKLGPQESATPWQQIHIVASEAKAKAELAQLESLHTALAKILQNQLRARAAAAGLPKLTTETEAGKLAGDVRGQQVAVQKATAEVVDVDRTHRRARSAHDQARGEQAGPGRDGPGGPPGRGPGTGPGRRPSWASPPPF